MNFSHIAKAYPYCFRDLQDGEDIEGLIAELNAGGLPQWGMEHGVEHGDGVVLWNSSLDKRFFVVEVQSPDDSGYFAVFDDSIIDTAGNPNDGDAARALAFAKQYRQV